MLKKKFPRYPPEFNEVFKAYIRERDGFTCSNPRCGKKNTRLDVHHIDYNRFHTTPLNCICLCEKCHKEIHNAGWVLKQDWKYKLWRIAGERERSYGKSR